MRNAVTVSLPQALTEELDAASREAGTSRSEIVRDALKRYFMLREYRALRAELMIEAEAKGIITDEDVEKNTSFAAKIGAVTDAALELAVGTTAKST